MLEIRLSGIIPGSLLRQSGTKRGTQRHLQFSANSRRMHAGSGSHCVPCSFRCRFARFVHGYDCRFDRLPLPFERNEAGQTVDECLQKALHFLPDHNDSWLHIAFDDTSIATSRRVQRKLNRLYLLLELDLPAYFRRRDESPVFSRHGRTQRA